MKTLSPKASDYPIADIKVDEERRQRQQVDSAHVDDLAQSIALYGLMNPVVIDSDGYLIAGEHRLEAFRKLGRTHIPVQLYSDLTLADKQVLSLEENIKRKDITWQERASAILKYHVTRVHENPDWTYSQTADSLGMSKGYISRMCNVGRNIDDPTVAACSTATAAAGLLERRAQRNLDAELEQIGQDIKLDDKGDLLPAEPKPEPEEEQSTEAPPFVNADVMDWIESYNGDPFNFLHVDFPYGINFDKVKAARKSNPGRYADSPEDMRELVEFLPRIPTASKAHMLFWFSPIHYAYVKHTLQSQGWKVHDFPLLWIKSDNSGILPDRRREGRRVYEMAFQCSKGDRFIVRPVNNAYSGPQSRYGHPSEKSLDMLEHFFRMFVDSSTIMLDPTSGSGNAVRVAHRLGAKRVLGVEADSEYYEDACKRWLTG